MAACFFLQQDSVLSANEKAQMATHMAGSALRLLLGAEQGSLQPDPFFVFGPF